jgi:hypothetical protein
MRAMRAQSAVGLGIRNRAFGVCIGCRPGYFLGKAPVICSADDVKKLKLNAERSSVSNTDVGTTKEPNKEESVDVATAMQLAVAQLNASSPRCAQCLAACDAHDNNCVQNCQDPPKPSCEICPAGTASEGGTASECTPCKRGASTLPGPHTIASCALRSRADWNHGCSGVGVGLQASSKKNRGSMSVSAAIISAIITKRKRVRLCAHLVRRTHADMPGKAAGQIGLHACANQTIGVMTDLAANAASNALRVEHARWPHWHRLAPIRSRVVLPDYALPCRL